MYEYVYTNVSSWGLHLITWSLFDVDATSNFKMLFDIQTNLSP